MHVRVENVSGLPHDIYKYPCLPNKYEFTIKFGNWGAWIITYLLIDQSHMLAYVLVIQFLVLTDCACD